MTFGPLKKREYRSEYRSTQIGIPKNFFLQKFSQNLDFPKTSLKHTIKGPWGPYTPFYDSKCLGAKRKNFDPFPPKWSFLNFFRFSLLHWVFGFFQCKFTLINQLINWSKKFTLINQKILHWLINDQLIKKNFDWLIKKFLID